MGWRDTDSQLLKIEQVKHRMLKEQATALNLTGIVETHRERSP
jgi:hypothetical protein